MTGPTTDYLLHGVRKEGMNVVAYVGTFDPVHEGHIETARQCLAFGADEVVFVSKTSSDSKDVDTDRSHRVKMVVAATEGVDGFNVYTADPSVYLDTSTGDFTLKRLLQHIAELYQTDRVGEVCGSDAFARYPPAANPQYFFGQVILITQRPGFPRPVDVPNGIVLDHTPSFSSTEIRLHASNPETTPSVLREKGAPQAVLDYIVEHGLYM